MPIESPVGLRPISQEEFAKVDYQVMRHAFDSQNDLGRLCEEMIYRNDLAARLESAGLGIVRKEVPVTVRHRDFAKTFRLDLVVGDSAIYELKTEPRLAAEHEAQLLHYQRFRLASDETAFRLTAFTRPSEDFEAQLHSLLLHSPLRAIQWINFAGHRVQFVTVTR